jgi:DNA-binding CsgD family transcriptional regulator
MARTTPAELYVCADSIIMLIAGYLDIDPGRLLGRTRDQESAGARQFLCYVLLEAGYSLAQIARRVGRDHSTVRHAVQRVARQPNLAREGQQLASAAKHGVLVTGGAPMDTAQHQAIARLLAHALAHVVSPRDSRAVQIYVSTLFGHYRGPAPLAAWGLRVIGTQARAWATVNDVLAACNLSAYCGLIELQLQHVGWLRSATEPRARGWSDEARGAVPCIQPPRLAAKCVADALPTVAQSYIAGERPA